MNWEMIGGFVRHLLTFGGGFLVANGTLTDPDMQTAVAALVSLAGVIWSIWAKKAA